MIEAFDSDVLIYAANGIRLADWVVSILAGESTCIGSVILLPEVLGKPLRLDSQAELSELQNLLAHIDLKVVDEDTAESAAGFSAKYALKAADAIHLATAVMWGAERFHTNNRKDFGPHITEIEVVHPASAS